MTLKIKLKSWKIVDLVDLIQLRNRKSHLTDLVSIAEQQNDEKKKKKKAMEKWRNMMAFNNNKMLAEKSVQKRRRENKSVCDGC